MVFSMDRSAGAPPAMPTRAASAAAFAHAAFLGAQQPHVPPHARPPAFAARSNVARVMAEREREARASTHFDPRRARPTWHAVGLKHAGRARTACLSPTCLLYTSPRPRDS